MNLGSALKYLDISKSSYCHKPKPRSESKRVTPLDDRLTAALKALQGYELTIGYGKVTDYLRNKHVYIWNEKKVYRHMKSLNLLQPSHIKRRWRQNKRLAAMCVLGSNMRWEMDITFVATEMGALCLFAIIDTYDKGLVGDSMDIRATAAQAVDCLKQAVLNRFGVLSAKGLTLVVRVDRGCQFTAAEFELAAKAMDVKIEFCGVQAPNDKPYIESFFGCYKNEEVYRNQYANYFEAYEGWKNYKIWYEHSRPHGSLGNLSPMQFRNQQNLNQQQNLSPKTT
jgi:putative transposase